MAGRVRKWFAKSAAKCPWDDIAELRDVPPARAQNVYWRARARLRASPAWWAVFLASALVFSVAGPVGMMFDRISGRVGAFFWPWLLIACVLCFLSITLLRRITNRALRRCIRAELGTHCRGCDYDLRGTPDAIPPAVARCPECGRVIARNVHRRTVVEGAVGGLDDGGPLEQKGED